MVAKADHADDGCYPKERVTNLPAEQYDETVYCDQRGEPITAQWAAGDREFELRRRYL